MALLGPMVVVSETSAAHLLELLSHSGAFPIIETGWADAPAALAEVQPVAVAIAKPPDGAASRHSRALAHAIQTRGGPVTPVFVLLDTDDPPGLPGALPVAQGEQGERFIARLRSALRIRTLHATVLRRARTADSATAPLPVPGNLLSGATVLCVGRGGSYPALSVALGERVGLIGAFSVETAARYLNARDIDGMVIGEGLAPRAVDALLTALAEDPRFRDLPVGLLNRAAEADRDLPNLIRVDNALRLVERILPFVRLRAFESDLKRALKSLESDGFIDPHTGLLESRAFWRDLDRALTEAEESGSALSVARFSFDGISDARAYTDAARLFSRLVRTVDFACSEQDGSILAAFTGTDLRSAHVVARRIASMLKETMLSPGGDRRTIKPSITLAMFKPTDNLSTLAARVGAYPTANAAG